MQSQRRPKSTAKCWWSRLSIITWKGSSKCSALEVAIIIKLGHHNRLRKSEPSRNHKGTSLRGEYSALWLLSWECPEGKAHWGLTRGGQTISGSPVLHTYRCQRSQTSLLDVVKAGRRWNHLNLNHKTTRCKSQKESGKYAKKKNKSNHKSGLMQLAKFQLKITLCPILPCYLSGYLVLISNERPIGKIIHILKREPSPPHLKMLALHENSQLSKCWKGPLGSFLFIFDVLTGDIKMV